MTRHLHERPDQHCYPHVSGDVFRLFADHVVDDTRQPFDAKAVDDGDVIFLKTKYLKKFLKYMHPKIQQRYVLITGNGDEEAPGEFAHLLDDKKLIRWFAMNTTIDHPKLVTIPIGAGDMGPDNKERLLHKMMCNPPKKRELLYLNFRPDNHFERAKALAYFEDQAFCFVDSPCYRELFFERVAAAKYTLCPRGNGLDTQRVWECLLLGSIPVLKSNELDPLYADLPVLIVQEWSAVTATLLENSYDELCSGSYNWEKLTAAYWLKQIKQEKFDEAKLQAGSYLDFAIRSKTLIEHLSPKEHEISQIRNQREKMVENHDYIADMPRIE